MWPRLTCFIVMIGPILGSEGDVRAEIRSELRERSYLVSGKSAMEVAAFMRRRPFRGDYGPAIANIRPRYSFTFKTEQSKNHCRVTRFNLKIDFTMTLPKARQEPVFDRRTLSAWRSLRGFTRRHELGHRKIYLGCAKRLERAVLSLRPRKCGGMGWKIRKLLNEEKKACKPSRGERIGFFHQIRSATNAGLGGEQHEAAGDKGRRLEITAFAQPFGNILVGRAFAARNRDMRNVFAPLCRQLQPLQDPLLFGLQFGQFRAWFNPCPDSMRLAVAEGAEASQPDLDRIATDAVQRIDDLVGGAVIDITDETQGQMIVFRIDPAGTPKASPEH
eukprot:g2484.t1